MEVEDFVKKLYIESVHVSSRLSFGAFCYFFVLSVSAIASLGLSW